MSDDETSDDVLRGKLRQAIFRLNSEDLAGMAFRARSAGHTPRTVVMICVDADDPTWGVLAEALWPGFAATSDAQAIRGRGEKLILQGSAQRQEVVEYATAVIPDMRVALCDSPPSGAWHVAVFAFGGASVFHVRPKPEPS